MAAARDGRDHARGWLGRDACARTTGASPTACGAVRDARLWALLAEQWRAQGARVRRAVGDPAVGLARFAMSYPEAGAWAVIGRRRPAWLQ